MTTDALFVMPASVREMFSAPSAARRSRILAARQSDQGARISRTWHRDVLLGHGGYRRAIEGDRVTAALNEINLPAARTSALEAIVAEADNLLHRSRFIHDNPEIAMVDRSKRLMRSPTTSARDSRGRTRTPQTPNPVTRMGSSWDRH
jgi:hypothetical protein